MPRYQLRLPDNQTIESAIGVMIERSWDACKPYLDQTHIKPEDLIDFKEEIHIAIKPYLSAFDLCGLVPECAEEIEGNPMVDYEDRLYHLILPNTFVDFVDQLAYAAFYSIKHLLKQREAALEVLKKSFRRELNTYLYYNPACGRVAICNSSKPVNPWKQ